MVYVFYVYVYTLFNRYWDINTYLLGTTVSMVPFPNVSLFNPVVVTLHYVLTKTRLLFYLHQSFTNTNAYDFRFLPNSMFNIFIFNIENSQS